MDKQDEKMKIGILGGGLTGLTIAKALNKDYEVLEKDNECGGLCRSITEKGFTFDFGGHILYSREQWFLNWVKNTLKNNLEKKKRKNRVLIKGKYIKYPFENDLAHLPFLDNMRCLYYYLFNKYTKRKPTNFKQWIYYTFGKGIAEIYLMPYNNKIWNYAPEKMSLHWVAGRVPKPPKIDVVKSAFGIPTEGYSHQLYFYYPKHGGIQAMIKAVEENVKNIKTNFEIKKIKKQGKKWVVSDSKTKKTYDKIISTIPIDDLINTLDNVPSNVKKASKNLKYNSLITVLLGLDVEKLNDLVALYIPDPRVKFNRICFMNNFSENNAPKGKFALTVEFTANKGDGFFDKSDKEIINHAVNGLHKLKIINKNNVVYNRVARAKYAYVVYDIDYLKNIKIVKDYIEEQSIILCGRFAEFEYLNMDSCVKRGLELAKRLNRDG